MATSLTAHVADRPLRESWRNVGDALRLFAAREKYNADRFYGAPDRDTLIDRADAATALGRHADAGALQQRAQASGSAADP
jgi:hypothetical protein